MTMTPAKITNTIGKSNSLIGGVIPGGVRSMSLLSRPDMDPVEIVALAKERCKEPVKLSWENVYFEVETPPTEADKLADP